MDPTRYDHILKPASVFHWAKNEHFSTLITGNERSGTVEKVLPLAVKSDQLLARKYGPRLIYASPTFISFHRKDPGYNVPEEHRLWKEAHYLHVEHGLACTECIVRLWRSDLVNAEVISERYFRKGGVVPDWGILYGNTHVLLLCEFITNNYFHRSGALKLKTRRYVDNLGRFETRPEISEVRVLTIIDESRQTVQKTLGKLLPIFNTNATANAFYFTDYQSFCEVPLGKQLSAEIYFWAGDGKSYPLGEDHV